MSTPVIITGEICLTVTILGTGAGAIVYKLGRDALWYTRDALREGWVRGSLGFVPPAGREPAPHKNAAAGMAASTGGEPVTAAIPATVTIPVGRGEHGRWVSLRPNGDAA